MARTKAEVKVITEKSSKKKNLVSNYLFQFFEKNRIKKSFEDRAQKQLQTTMNEPGNTYFSYLDTGKVTKNISWVPIRSQIERKAASKIGDTITPKN